MAVKTYENFWSDRDGKEHGLIGQSTTNDAVGVALQVDETTGELLVRIPSTSPITIASDNEYDCVEVDLNVDRSAAGGLEIQKAAASIAGRNLSVVKTDGDFLLRLTSDSNDPIPQTIAEHGVFDIAFEKIYLEHAPLGAGKKAYLYVGRMV